MSIFDRIDYLIWYLVAFVIIATVALMLLRLVVSYADLNPFGWVALAVRRLTDPLVNPVRRYLLSYGVDPKFSPLVVILIAILLGYFAILFAEAVLVSLGGVVKSLQCGLYISLLGSILYGILAVYTLLIFMRVIFSWFVSYASPAMRFLVRATDPLLLPFRRVIPPLGMLDISPIIAIILLRLFQEAIAMTLLRQLVTAIC
jgi:YggT family protein